MPPRRAIIKAIVAEKKMRGGELLAATSLSIPVLSQTGTKIIAPPSPSAPPRTPAKNPETIEIHIL